MGKLNWSDVKFLAQEVAESYASYGPEQSRGARLLALSYCMRIRPGFDCVMFIKEVNEILRTQYGMPEGIK
ncbi:hypothetical protein LCGC14_2741920 [marine sediment metagenome]|uniref:Uncharacterized protein n=1 Tax=marine sediment metagenome TaxID=412755 RepID=A0A0F9BVX7_9ZZZZ